MNDDSITSDTIIAQIVSELNKSTSTAKSFGSRKDVDYICDVVNTRYQYLMLLKKKLGSTEAVINHVEAAKIKSSQDVINFPTNAIHPLTLVSPQAQSQFNGLLPLPTRVDILTGSREVYPDYRGEPIHEMEEMTHEDVSIISQSEPPRRVQFNLKRLRVKE